MINYWTERTKRLQEALQRSSTLRAAFTAYSFITLLFFTPAPALGGSAFAGAAPGSEIDDSSTLSLPGGDPAALESGDPVCRLRGDDALASRRVDFAA